MAAYGRWLADQTTSEQIGAFCTQLANQSMMKRHF
jgi:hypothetical protein